MAMTGRRGQSVTEYVVVISVVAAAVIGMQIFVKRGLQAKQRDVTAHFTDATGDVAELGVNLVTVDQYEPYYTAAGSYDTTTANTVASTKMLAGGIIQTTGIDESTARTGASTQDVDLSQDDDWITAPR